MRKHSYLHFDAAMIVLIVLQFFDLGMRIVVHRILGIALCVLVVIHLWQHRSWFKALVRGKWTHKRIVRSASIAVAVLMIAGLVSGFFVPSISSGSALFANPTGMEFTHHALAIAGSIGVAIHVIVQFRNQLARKRRVRRRCDSCERSRGQRGKNLQKIA